MSQTVNLNDLSMDQLRALFAQLNLVDDTVNERPIPDVLQGQVSLESFAAAIREGRVNRIITMAGAGISTSCGIPDFRTPGTGLYSQLESKGLNQPEDMFSIDFFKKNPHPFNELAKEIYPTNFQPSPTHCFLRLLQDKGVLLRHYTQNIDGLESLAGVRDEKLVEAHGHFRSAHCIECQRTFDGDEIKQQIFEDVIPRCECNGLIKPDIVFFGESLPLRFSRCVKEDFPAAQMLLVMGTSLMVAPFNGLVTDVDVSVPRMLINFEAVATLEKSQNEISQGYIPSFSADESFRFREDGSAEDSNYRDVFLKGRCDESIQQLVDLIGWTDEFNEIMREVRGES